MRQILTFFFSFLALSLSVVHIACAQDENIVNLQAEVRVDYQYEGVDGSKVTDNTGFKGQYLNVILNGNISKSFSYSYRQRLNKAHSSQSFFDATDWIYLTYSPGEHWNFSAGKLVVGIGGYEYDRAPIDLYTCSEFWNNIPCYQFGVNVGYKLNKGKDQLLFQVCQSPFRSVYDEDVYAYNLMWYGSHGWYNSIWSVNMIEYSTGQFINYIALGNNFKFGDFNLNVDFMNRATSHQTFLFKDCSVMGELSYSPVHWMNVFAKVTYDVNKTDRIADFCVMPGTELTLYGGGFEFFPLKNTKNLRFHANCFYSQVKNGNPIGTMVDKRTIVDVGVKWKMNILSVPKKKKEA